MARKNVSLSTEATSILEAAEPRAVSGYLSRLVEEADRRWRHAHMSLVTGGWSPAELRCACHCLGGTWLLGHRSPGMVAMELLDGARINKIHETHGVDYEQWLQRVEDVRRTAELAQCVIDLSDAFWADAPGLAPKLDV